MTALKDAKIPTPKLTQRLDARTIPPGNPMMMQRWRQILFLHWSYDPSQLQKFLPKGLFVDTFQGRAYVGIVVLFTEDIRPVAFGQALPGLKFYEVSLRTYVFDEKGRPGIWFFSLDAESWVAAKIGRWRFHLPYFYSAFDVDQDPDTRVISYTCQRRHKGSTSFSYRTLVPREVATPDSLDFFLVERYLLFCLDGNHHLYGIQIHHEPYHLFDVDLESYDDNLLAWNDLVSKGREPDHQIFSPGASVDVYPLHKLLNL